MKHILAVLAFLSGCSHHVVRKAEVYRLEVEWAELAMTQASDLLDDAAARALVDGDIDGCLRFAETSVVLRARGTWHSAMSLHLANLGDDPGDPPTIPGPDTICGKGAE